MMFSLDDDGREAEDPEEGAEDAEEDETAEAVALREAIAAARGNCLRII